MVKLVEFKKEHMKELLPFQEEGYKNFITDGVIEYLEQQGKNLTIVNDNDEVLICGGVRYYWPTRGELWAIFRNKEIEYSLSIHKIILRFVKISAAKRLEMVVHEENILGHKLALALGFKLESKMIAYRHDGGDASMYVRIN